MSRINFVPLIKQEGLQNAIIRNKKKLMPITGFAKRIETYDDIVSMPSNANGRISVTLKGKTATNLIKNGNFANGTTYWSATGGTISVVDGKLQLTENTSQTEHYAYQDLYILGIKPYVGMKVFVRAICFNGGKIVIYNRRSDGSYQHVDGNLVSGVGVSYAIITITDIYSTPTLLIRLYGKTGIYTGTGATYQFDDVFAIDLTALGLADKTADEINKMFPYWFDSTKSTLCAFRIRTKDDADNVTSEAYVIAKDPTTGEILEARSVPNGTKDEISVSEGKLIKRVSDELVIPTTGWELYTAGKSNTISFRVRTGATNIATVGDGEIPNIRTTLPFPVVSTYAIVNIDEEGISFARGVGYPDYVYISILRNRLTTQDVAGFQQWLQSNYPAATLNYQLASPVISKVDVFGDLKAFPGGTIYFEPTLWGFINFDYGQNSKTITTPDVPIGSIRKVIRYDITDDGRLVEVDVTADCTHNGTTLTIANAEPKKTYFYDCEIAPGYSTSAEKIIDVGTHEGVAVHDYGAAAADWVLSTNEALATMLVCINAGGAAKIIAPAAEGKMYIIRNESGQTITIKTASSTGVTVANGKTATVIFYNTDFIKIGEV